MSYLLLQSVDYSSQSVIAQRLHLIVIKECVSWKSIDECERNSGDIRGCNVKEAFDPT